MSSSPGIDISQCQKRPTTVSKETYYSVRPDEFFAWDRYLVPVPLLLCAVIHARTERERERERDAHTQTQTHIKTHIPSQPSGQQTEMLPHLRWSHLRRSGMVWDGLRWSEMVSLRWSEMVSSQPSGQQQPRYACT